MPTNNTSNPLDWNEENLERVISDLYSEIETDAALRAQLQADPFEVLSSRIAIPESYRGGILLVPKGQDSMALYTPAPDAPRTAAPEGTTEEESQPDYKMLCTAHELW